MIEINSLHFSFPNRHIVISQFLCFHISSVSKKYLVDDMSEDSKLIFNKMSVVQKSKSDIIANANFEVEKADILIAHYMEQLKDNLPEPMEDEEESANDGDKKPN